MPKIFQNILETIGRTPMVALTKLSPANGAKLFAKCESFNPGGSAKDRVAIAMIEAAEAKGKLQPGGTLIEPTSGNTGIGLALAAAVKGYHLILTMPDTMSVERRRLAAAYGAEIVLSDGSLGMAGAIAKAEELQAAIPNSFIPQQFENPANPLAHELTTGPEIWEDMDGQIDAFVAGAGTGGTLTGVARYLKKKNPSVHIIAVEPDSSAVLSGKPAGPHPLQGIGAGFIPATLDTSLLDEVLSVTGEEAGNAARELAQKEGILSGISAGAALHAAKLVASRPEWQGKNIVILLPDTGERYLSTWLFADN